MTRLVSRIDFDLVRDHEFRCAISAYVCLGKRDALWRTNSASGMLVATKHPPQGGEDGSDEGGLGNCARDLYSLFKPMPTAALAARGSQRATAGMGPRRHLGEPGMSASRWRGPNGV